MFQEGRYFSTGLGFDRIGVNFQDNCKEEVETYIQYMKDKHFYRDHLLSRSFSLCSLFLVNRSYRLWNKQAKRDI